MFNTLGSFSAVYFALAAVLFVLILFEKHFIRLEDKIKARKKSAYKTVKAESCQKPVQKNASRPVTKNSRSKAVAVRRIPNNAA